MEGEQGVILSRLQSKDVFKTSDRETYVPGPATACGERRSECLFSARTSVSRRRRLQESL